MASDGLRCIAAGRPDFDLFSSEYREYFLRGLLEPVYGRLLQMGSGNLVCLHQGSGRQCPLQDRRTVTISIGSDEGGGGLLQHRE